MEHEYSIVYDSIIVGSSPIAMLEAMYLALNNKQCLIIDSEDRIGGAWAVRDNPYFMNVDLGPHYMGATKKGFDVFYRLGVVLEQYDPSEEWRLLHPFLGIRSVTYDKRWVCGISMYYGGTGYLGKIKAVVQYFWKHTIEDCIRFNKKRYLMYPKYGLSSMLDRFSEILKHLGVGVRLGSNLSGLSLNSNKTMVTALINGQPIQSKEVVITNFSRIGKIFVDERQLHYPVPKTVNLLELQLVVSDPNMKPFSAIKFTKHKYVTDYVTNVSHYALPRYADRNDLKIMLCRVWPGPKPDLDTAEDVIKMLKEVNVLSSQATYVWHDWYETNRLFTDDKKMEKVLQRTNNKIRMLYTASLGPALAKYSSRWAKKFRQEMPEIPHSEGMEPENQICINSLM